MRPRDGLLVSAATTSTLLFGAVRLTGIVVMAVSAVSLGSPRLPATWLNP